MIKIWQFHGENNQEMQNEINCWLVADPQIVPIHWMQSESMVSTISDTAIEDARLTISCVYTRSAQEFGTT